MTSCKEIIRKIASDEFREAGWKERLAVRFHLFLCRHCRGYAAQLRAIGAATREFCGPPAQDPSTLERLERQILERTRRGA
ncbi:MAG: anti-sigma factor [Acidobacteriota bacterium]